MFAALYREALALGLGEDRRRQCVVQLAQLAAQPRAGRGGGGAAGGEERDAGLGRGWTTPSRVLALALADACWEREALSVVLLALTGHMDRYRRSLTAERPAEPSHRGARPAGRCGGGRSAPFAAGGRCRRPATASSGAAPWPRRRRRRRSPW